MSDVAVTPPPSSGSATPTPTPPPARPAPSPETVAAWSADPAARRAADEAERRRFDPHIDADRVLRQDRSGRVVDPKTGALVDGPPPGQAAAAPEAPASEGDKPKIRIGNSVDGFEEVDEATVRIWREEHARQESRRATLPKAEEYKVELPSDFKAPEAFKDWKPDGNHMLMGQLREFSHSRRFKPVGIFRIARPAQCAANRHGDDPGKSQGGRDRKIRRAGEFEN
jgi:hypothetical protein